jgi:hypothetical protein
MKKAKSVYPTVQECKWLTRTLCQRNPRLFEIATTPSLRAEVAQAIITTWIGMKGGRLIVDR